MSKELYFTGEEIVTIEPECEKPIDEKLYIRETMDKGFCEFLCFINKFDGGYLGKFVSRRKI